MKKGKNIFVLVILLVIGVCTNEIYKYTQEEKLKEYNTLYDSLNVIFTTEIQFIEYGTQDFDEKQFIQNHNGKLTYHDELDTMTIGDKKLKFTITEEHEKFGTLTRDSFYTATVKDTRLPVIELNSDEITLEYGSEYDPKTNIKKVYDIVDGDLEYEITHEVDTTKVGEYMVAVSAKDKNGNKTSKEFKVIVKEKIKETSKNNNNKNNTGNKTDGGKKEEPKE